MMQAPIAAALATGLLLTAALPVLAQGEAGPESIRVEVPEAGISVAFPAQWAVDIEMREREDWGFVEDDDDVPVAFWQVLYASESGRPWCDLTWYPAHPLTHEDHAVLYEDLNTPSVSSVERTIERSPVVLPAGEAYRFAIYNEPTETWTAAYLLGDGEARYLLRCASDERDPTDWMPIAESLELLAAEEPSGNTEEAGRTPDASPGPQRIEVPEAGIAMAFPDDWSVVVQMVREEAEVPPGTQGGRSVSVWHVLDAAAPDGTGCVLGMYVEHPLAFDDHVTWVGEGLATDEDATLSAQTSVDTAIGTVYRFDVLAEGVGSWTDYLFELDEVRYRLGCGAAEPPEGAWLDILESARPIPLQLPVLPEEGEGPPTDQASLVTGFSTAIPVIPADTPDFPVGALMYADCAFALWEPSADGSATEWLACTLNDEAMEPPDYQGQPPEELLFDSGGECLWRSDYWYETDRTQLMASSFETVVTPSGQVYGRSTYPSEPLDCLGM